MSTRADYRASVRARGYDGKTDAILDDVINEGRLELLSRHRWSYMLGSTTLALASQDGDADLSTITDLGAIEAVRVNTASGQLENMTWLNLDDLRDYQIDAGTAARALPEVWTRVGSTLLVAPTTDAAYTLAVDYVKTAELAEGVEDVIPDIDRALVVWMAVTSLGFRDREAWAMEYAGRRAETLLRSAIDRDQKQQRQQSDQVKPYWGSTRYASRTY